MTLGIGAIFRDEFDYITEWIAWHEMAGFTVFYIADNGSTDGTRELLEALSDLGIINLIYQPVVESLAQIRAYNRISQLSVGKTDAILFIDSDEFLTHDSMRDGAEYECLSKLLEDREVGMVGINWRLFGSSGLETQDDRLVIERFTSCLSDRKNNKNGHLKSISKVLFCKDISGPHITNFLDSHRRINSVGGDLTNFINIFHDKIETADNTGITAEICRAPLRINHYVVKSKQEYIEKKRKRGDAMIGVNYDRGMPYFHAHDFDDQKFTFPTEKIERLKSRILEIQNKLKTTNFFKKLQGFLDINNQDGIQGWLADEYGESKGLKVNIFVNDIYQGSCQCGFYRPDLKVSNISTEGMNGFRYTHPAPLKSGDVIEVKVHANRFQFPLLSKYKIE